MKRATWISAGALSVVCAVGAAAATPGAAATASAVQQWSTPGAYTYTPPAGANGALVIASGAGGAGTWTGFSPTPGAVGGGGAVVTGYVPIDDPSQSWTVRVGGAGTAGGGVDVGASAAGGGGSSGVYTGSSATMVIAGGGGGAGMTTTSGTPPGTGGSAGNPDGSGQAGTGSDAGYGGAGGSGGAGQGTWEGKGASGGNGDGGPGGSACCGGGGGSGPPRGGDGGSASSHQMGGGGGGGYGGGASGGALALFNAAGGGGGAGGSFAPTLPGLPAPVYETQQGQYTGADGEVMIATVAPAEDVTATPVANGSVAISWQEPTQYSGFETSYEALVDGHAALDAPGIVDGLDPTQPVEITVVASAGPLQAITPAQSVTPAVEPTITGVTPASGTTAGNFPVTVTGSGFLEPATVTFDGNQATDVAVLSDTMITATVPGGVAGDAPVVVTNQGTSLSSPDTTGVFTYFEPGPPVAAPAIVGLSIAGNIVVGSDLVTQVTASGDPAPTLTFQWASGDTGTGPWTDIPGATAAGYVPSEADMGDFLRVTVTATNGVNPPAESEVVTDTAVAGRRARVGAVAVTGTAEMGTVLTAAPHGITGVPSPTVTYQWQSRVAGTWSDIAGADSIDFVPTAAQVDVPVRVKVSVDNGVGAPATSTSPATTRIKGVVPSISGVSLQGDPAVGGVITADVNGVGGVPEPDLRYQWQQGSGTDGSWSDISGQKSQTMTVPAAAAGSSVRVLVKAYNGVEPRAWATSAPAQIPAVPAAIGKVKVAGKAQIGKTLSAQVQAVTGDPTPQLSYTWQRRGKASKWHSLKGQRQTTLTVRRAWYRERLRVRVTAVSAGEQVRKVSAATPKVRGGRPGVDSLSPRRGSSAGGTRVTITGSGFLPSPRVRIGGARCRVLSVAASTIVCRTSARRAGKGAVIVRNADGRDAVLAKAFRYLN